MAAPKPCTSNIIVQTFKPVPLILIASRNPYRSKPSLLLEPDPMCTLLDAPTLLRFEHLLRHPVTFLKHDGLAAHSGHERIPHRALLALVQRRASFRVQRTAAADAAQS